MNFNLDNNFNEYELFNSQTQELINLYGILLKFIKVDRVKNDYIFGESKSIKADGKNIFEMFGLPQEVDNWDGDWVLSSNFGLENQKNIFFVISAADIEKIFPDIQSKNSKGFDFIIGNLIMLPDGKLMEISDFVFEVQGGNNLFPYSNKKNVFGILCKPYYSNHDDLSELQTETIKEEEPEIYESVESLEELFSTEQENNEEIKKVATDTEEFNKQEVDDNKIDKKIIQNSPFEEWT